MTKRDLYTGMVIKTRGGRQAMVFLNYKTQSGGVNDILLYKGGKRKLPTCSLDSYGADLTYGHGSSNQIHERDIVCIYQPMYQTPIIDWIKNRDLSKFKKIWDRDSRSISISVSINGEKAKLSDLSEETLLRLREEN